jgi:hypothetical protein
MSAVLTASLRSVSRRPEVLRFLDVHRYNEAPGDGLRL